MARPIKILWECVMLRGKETQVRTVMESIKPYVFSQPGFIAATTMKDISDPSLCVSCCLSMWYFVRAFCCTGRLQGAKLQYMRSVWAASGASMQLCLWTLIAD